MTKKEIVRNWFDQVWFEGNTEPIYELFISDGVARGLGDRPIAGPAEFEAFQQAMLNLISEVDISIDKTFEDGDWICVFCTMRAKKKGSKQEVIMPGCTSIRVEDNKIVEAYNHWEFMGMFEQLGLLPPESFVKCLSGQGLA